MCHDLIRSGFLAFAKSLQKVGLNYGLIFHLVEVTSSFGEYNQVETRYGLDIRLVGYEELLGAELYGQLARAFGSNQKNPDLKLTLGYGLRTIDFQTNKASVTTGSHSSLTNEIMFDAPTYKLLSEEAMKHRFAHEMLHEFGLNEIEVLSIEDDYYQKIRHIDIKLLSSLYKRIPQAHADLESRVTQLFSECPAQRELLDKYVDELNPKLLSLTGLSINSIVEAAIDSTHPITKERISINLF